MDRLISEKVFYRAAIALIIGMPVIELITGIIYRFDNNMIPSSIEPLYMSLFGVLGTVLTAIYGADSLMRKRKIRTADFFYITLLLFMIISAVFSRNPGVYSGGDSLRC